MNLQSGQRLKKKGQALGGRSFSGRGVEKLTYIDMEPFVTAIFPD
jgi:hypothetical protein